MHLGFLQKIDYAYLPNDTLPKSTLFPLFFTNNPPLTNPSNYNLNHNINLNFR